MKILDRYIIRHFLISLVIFTVSLFCLYVVFDSMFQLKSVRFQIEDEDKASEEIFSGIVERLQSVGPLMLYQIAPFLVLMSAMFTVTRMNRLGELIPIKASGVSIYRALLPIFVIAGLIGVGIAIFQELYVPGLAERIRHAQGVVSMKPAIEKDKKGNTFAAASYHIPSKQMNGVLILHKGEQGFFHLRADYAVHATREDKSGWLVTRGRKISYTPDGILPTGGEGFVSKIPEEGVFVESDLTPVDIENQEDLATYLSMGDLMRLYAKNPGRHRYKVDLHVRLAYPFTFLVLLLIGLPCVLIPETKNVFMGIGICLLVCLVFIIMFVFFTEMGYKGTLSAYTAAWEPVLVFGLFGILMFDFVKT